MSQPAPGTSAFTLSRLLMLAACALFVVAALMAGGVITAAYLPWLLGAFAAVALAWALPL